MEGSQNGVSSKRPTTIGVMGGSFNPIHLGHVLLAMTVKQTKPVDKVVIVPVFKHFVKTDLLPFEDRVAMCRLAVQVEGVEISTVEQDIGESNVAMLRALRSQYPKGTRLLWVCGDDVFDWIGNVKGQEMLVELDGLIVQRRLHRAGATSEDSFFKSPLDEVKISKLTADHGLQIDFMHGELPHFSSTLVRTSPKQWRAFLPHVVSSYLDKRPHLLALLMGHNATEAMAQFSASVEDQPCASPATEDPDQLAACVTCCLSVVHSLQFERGRAALALSIGDAESLAALAEAQQQTDRLLKDLPYAPGSSIKGSAEAAAMMAEVANVTSWLARDRGILRRHITSKASEDQTACGWLQSAALVRKFNARIDVIIDCCTQTLSTQVEGDPLRPKDSTEEAPEPFAERLLFSWQQWVKGKEAIGRERAFVCAGGRRASALVRGSFRIRRRLNEVIEYKERQLELITASESALARHTHSAELALDKMLLKVTALEWSLMRCFGPATPLHVVHNMLAGPHSESTDEFSVQGWFAATSSVVDLMLNLVQALAAHICSSASDERPGDK
mmetsp:Transcript_11159/g.24971  ORF Transcript_11159/g.24971 Transcript_11159/m.24971 type:complete len:559 (+) Transcript_11159:36-1712(+)|eukprot:CAMPEP_0170594088 /NCGR_PEP_ID=MMETSP0224-20130122/13808_1 /TAXON_ID=285029 /ORGANISM="Togula jolla, Strain CCCM 725" /LENGTH=558 /DNA_ID=CAMNT_0010918111 /DNA_START=36 /DNA_END=1712 /DNA_ORIENTATION=+